MARHRITILVELEKIPCEWCIYIQIYSCFFKHGKLMTIKPHILVEPMAYGCV